jgi:hypothetical protein
LIFVVEYLREYESIFETDLSHEYVDPGALFDEKAGGQKSCETVTLKCWIWIRMMIVRIRNTETHCPETNFLTHEQLLDS